MVTEVMIMESAKKKITISVAASVALVLAVTAAYLIATNRQYSFDISNMPVTVDDIQGSYIAYTQVDNMTFYDYALHYDKIDLIQGNFGTPDIFAYYNANLGYSEVGTKIDCEVTEKNKDYAVLHYFGTGVTPDGETTNVDDYWRFDIANLWNGEYAGVTLTEA
jgi:hypothetical protein